MKKILHILLISFLVSLSSLVLKKVVHQVVQPLPTTQLPQVQ